jgi:hypothetical protein
VTFALLRIFTWQVNDNAVWLTTQPQGDTVAVSVNQSGLGKGTYQGTVTISAVGVSGVSSVNIPVTLVVVEQLSSCYLPFVRK